MSLAPLRVRAFRHLLAAYAVNQLGDWAAEVGLAVIVFAATRSAAAVAATWVVHRCGFALLAPVVVARLERRRVERVLPGIYAVEAALFLALAASAPVAGLGAVLPLVALDGLLAPSARALARSTLVSVTRPAGLHREGNALINVVFTVNGMLAPALGGVLVAGVGAPGALVVDAASFAAAAAALAGCRPPVKQADDNAAQCGAARRLRDALHYVRRRAVVRDLLAADVAVALFISMITPVEVVFVTDTLGAGSGGLGVVLSAWGVGMVLGGVLAGRVGDRRPGALLLASAAAQAVACVGMGASAAVGSVVVFSAVGGVGNGAGAMSVLTAVQERTADAFQARVNALYDALMSVAPGLGFAAGGALAATGGPRAAYIAAGAGALAVIAWATPRLRTADWTLPGEPVPSPA